MENKTPVLITIIVLLFIFVPLTIIGFFARGGGKPKEENPGHEFIYNGYLWFYDEDDNYINKYECINAVCNLAEGIIDDDEYGFNYYKDGTSTLIEPSHGYAFIVDGENVSLFQMQSGLNIPYKAVKTYQTKLENNSYILQNSNGLWGVISISNNISNNIPFEYNFIGLKNTLNADNTLSTKKFVVKEGEYWYIIDEKNSSLSKTFTEPIIDYTDTYILVKEDDEIKIYDYESNNYLDNYTIRDYAMLDDYIAIVTDRYIIVYQDLNSRYLDSVQLPEDSEKVTLENDGVNLNIVVDGDVIKSIALD